MIIVLGGTMRAISMKEFYEGVDEEERRDNIRRENTNNVLGLTSGKIPLARMSPAVKKLFGKG